MNTRLTDYVYPLLTVLLTVYGQLVVKWRVANLGTVPVSWSEKFHLIGNLLLDFRVLSAFGAAFLAALCWMIALTRFQLSVAYPLTSLSFVLVLVFSGVFFKEPMTAAKWTGIALILIGTVIASSKQ